MRVLRSAVRRLTDDASPVDNVAAMQRVLRCVVRQKRAAVASRRPGADQALDKTETLEKQLAVLMFDQELSHGLPQTLGHLDRTAGLVRDRLSVDAWRTLGRLHTKATVNAHLVGSPAHPRSWARHWRCWTTSIPCSPPLAAWKWKT